MKSKSIICFFLSFQRRPWTTFLYLLRGGELGRRVWRWIGVQMLMLSIPQLSEGMKSIQSKRINPSIAIALAPLLDLWHLGYISNININKKIWYSQRIEKSRSIAVSMSLDQPSVSNKKFCIENKIKGVGCHSRIASSKAKSVYLDETREEFIHHSRM